MTATSTDSRWLDDVPALTAAAVASANRDPRVGCLIDRVEPGCPLIVSFAFADWNATPSFDFFEQTKTLEQNTGIRLNRILLRDVENAWYHRGVPGLGTHVDEVAATLRMIIRTIAPSEVITVGQAMGGYAAIMFGMLIGARRIVAFGPLSHLDPDELARLGDRRYLGAVEQLRAEPPRTPYFDLLPLAEALNYQGAVHVVFGTDPGVDDSASGHLDAVHAFRLAQAANVTLHPSPDAEHAVVKWLIDHGQIDDLLARLLLPATAPMTAAGEDACSPVTVEMVAGVAR